MRLVVSRRFFSYFYLFRMLFRRFSKLNTTFVADSFSRSLFFSFSLFYLLFFCYFSFSLAVLPLSLFACFRLHVTRPNGINPRRAMIRVWDFFMRPSKKIKNYLKLATDACHTNTQCINTLFFTSVAHSAVFGDGNCGGGTSFSETQIDLRYFFL